MTAKKITNQNMPNDSKLIIDKEEFRTVLNARIATGVEILERPIQRIAELDNAKIDYDLWSDYNEEFLKQSFDNPYNEYKKDYQQEYAVGFYLGESSPQEKLNDFKETVGKKVNVLKKLLSKIDLLKVDLPIRRHALVEAASVEVTKAEMCKDVFIVHGHNNEIKEAVARTLQKLDLNPIILHEQANSGKTIIEKFEKHSNVGFAIVLLTDDDLGKSKKDELDNARARQNVILEMGYFIGKLGRDKVCPLYSKGVELPSDLYGLLYIELDSSAHWQISIAKELKAAGYSIDLNKLI